MADRPIAELQDELDSRNSFNTWICIGFAIFFGCVGLLPLSAVAIVAIFIARAREARAKRDYLNGER